MLCVVCCVVWAKETGQEVGLWIVANWQIMLIHDEEQDGIQETKKGPPTGLRGNLKGASVLAGWQSIITAKLSWSCVALRPPLALLLFGSLPWWVCGKPWLLGGLQYGVRILMSPVSQEAIPKPSSAQLKLYSRHTSDIDLSYDGRFLNIIPPFASAIAAKLMN